MLHKYSYCGKCFTQEKDFEDISFVDDWDEIGSQCPTCKTNLYLTGGDVLPVKTLRQPLLVSVAGNVFDLQDWESKRELAQIKQDKKLNAYFEDCNNIGKENAKLKYLKIN
jgi:hypothetical protein